jgi:coenzyme F420-reducing hydrogenase alpha subunit
MSNENNWKWGQSSQNAFQLVGGFFGFTPSKAIKATDAETSKLLKAAAESDTQVKRTQDYVNALKKTWRNQIKTGAMIHGLVRTGLGLLGQQQQQEATTTKEYAKQITNTRVLSAKTQTQVEKTYLKGAKQIDQAGKQLQRSKAELDAQFQVVDETAEQASQQRQLGYRERAQKRLASQQKPWRNY